jgi:hypothetical protein
MESRDIFSNFISVKNIFEGSKVLTCVMSNFEEVLRVQKEIVHINKLIKTHLLDFIVEGKDGNKYEMELEVLQAQFRKIEEEK